MRKPYTTRSGLQIGIRAPFAMPEIYGTALMLQTALLDKRTNGPQSLLQRVIGALVTWL